MTTKLRTAASTAALLLVVTGCGVLSDDPKSRLIVEWTGTTYPELERQAAEGLWRTRLVTTRNERSEFLTLLPTEVPVRDRSKIERVDLSTQLILVGVFGNCGAISSRVERTDDALDFVVEHDDVDCAAPHTAVQVWSVDRTELPTPILVRDQRGDPA